MDTGIKIEANLDKDTSDNVKSMVEGIFKAGYDYHMDQATIVQALNVAKEISSVNHATIYGCSFNG